MRCLIIAALALMLSLPVAAQDFWKGAKAHTRGDYATALRELRPLAERGEVLSQYLLGLMYHEGRGVPQDYAEAVKWYRKSAEQGLTHAEYNLGIMYHGGWGVPQDLVQAYMWWSIAGEHGHPSAADARNEVAEQMTPEDVSKAQRLAREWMEKHGK